MSNTIAGGSVVWDLDADDQKLNSKVSRAKGTVQDLGDTTKKQGGVVQTSFADIAKGALAFVGVTSVLDAVKNATVGSVLAFGDYQSQMGILKQVTGATAGQMGILGNLAVQLGNDISLPGVSAADAAGAMTELGKAGLNVNDIMKASKGVLSLAKAGQIDVAAAAGIAANALNSFGLSGDKANMVADLLAAGANASTASVDGMAQALQQVGSGAKQMGVSVNDTVAALSLFANAGIQGSDAGTSLKTMFMALATPTKQQSDLMKQLGVDFFDAQGNFIGLEQTAGMLQSRLGKLTPEARNAALGIIFGSDAARAAGILTDQGAAGFDKMRVAVNKQGAAADLAAAANTGIKGSLEALKSALETTALKMGEFISIGLKPIVDAAAGNLPVALGIAGGAILGIGTAAVIANPAVITFAAALWAAISPALPFIAAGAAIGGALVYIEQKTGILSAAFDTIKTAFSAVASGAKILFEALTGGDPTVGVTKNMMGFAHAMEYVQLASLAVQDAAKGIWNAIQVIVTGDFKGGIFGLTEDSPIVGALLTIHRVLTAVKDVIVGNLTAAWDNMVKIAEPALKAIGDIFNSVIKPAIEQLVPLFQKLMPVLKVIGEVIMVVFGAAVVAAIAAILAPVIAVIAAITALSFVIRAVVAVFGAIVSVITTVVAAVVAVAQAVWSVLKPPLDAIIFIVKSIGEVFYIVFSTIATVVFTIISTIAQIIFVVFLGILKFIWETFLQPILNFFISVFTGIWNAISGPLNSAWQFISSIFNSIWNFIKGVVSSLAAFLAERFQNIKNNLINPIGDALNAIGGFIGRMAAAGRDLITGLVNGLRDNAGKVVDFIKGICANALDAVKKFFKIGSPSKVMHDQGSYIMQGLANGIAAGADAAKNAALEAAGMVAGGFGDLAAGGMSLAADVSGSGGIGSGTAGNVNNITQVNNVYDQVDMNRVTRDLAWRTRR